MSSFGTLLPLMSTDPGSFKPGTFFVEPHLELVLGRQLELVARHEHIAVACGGEAHNLGVTFCAEQNSNGWILLWIGNMLGQVIDVEAKRSQVSSSKPDVAAAVRSNVTAPVTSPRSPPEYASMHQMLVPAMGVSGDRWGRDFSENQEVIDSV